MSEIFTPREIQDYHRQVSAAERVALQALYDGDAESTTSVSPQFTRAVLQRYEAYILRHGTSEESYARSSAPTPGLYLIKSTLALLSKTPEQRPTFMAFLGEIALPLARLAQHDRLEINPDLEDLSTCKKAENYFLDTVQQITKQQYNGQKTVRAYYDAEGPVALRKTKDRETALLLRSTRGIPAGTIVGIGTESLRETTGYKGDGWIEEACEIDDTLSLRPFRITPWAYSSPEDRAMFAVGPNSNTYDSSLGDDFSRTSLGDFKEAASKILTHCGLEVGKGYVPPNPNPGP